jgi:hypothetical protein
MNKFSFLLAALCVSLHAQEAKPADAKAAAPAPDVKLSGGAKAEPKTYIAEVWVGKSIGECNVFQKNIQVINIQIEELKRLNIFLENALTTPEKEARGHDIAAKRAKLIGDCESMAKMYGGFNPLQRPGQLVPTKQVYATLISNEEFAKISSAGDFKADSVITMDDKRFQIKDTIVGQADLETFALSINRITEAKTRLQQLVDVQPKLTKDDDKKKIEKAIKEIQDELSKSLEEFKKARGFDFTAEAITLPSEAKLIVQLSEDEWKKANEGKAPAAPAADEKK